MHLRTWCRNIKGCLNLTAGLDIWPTLSPEGFTNEVGKQVEDEITEHDDIHCHHHLYKSGGHSISWPHSAKDCPRRRTCVWPWTKSCLQSMAAAAGA